jgi:hypothetical protein
MSVVCRKSIVSMRRCVVDVLHDGVEGEWDELSWGENLGLHIQERKFITSHVQAVRTLLAEMQVLAFDLIIEPSKPDSTLINQ